MKEFYQLNRLFVFCVLLSAYSCGSEQTDQVSETTAEIDTNTVIEEVTEIESEILFEGVFNTAGNLESREEMIEVLGRIGVHDYSGESYKFLHVEETESGYVQTCDYDFNGSLNFLFSGSETLTEFYDNYEPVFEHNGQDLFPYYVEDIFVNPTEKELMLKTRSLQNENGFWGTDMAYDAIYLTIEENPDFGPIMTFNDRLFMREDFYNSIPAKECEPYEP